MAEYSSILLENAVEALSKLPGVGKKTAQRITLELRDKITQAEVSSVNAVADIPVKPQAADSLGEALEALMALGYTATEARTALSHVKDRNAPVDELITQALRSMASL